MCTLNTGVYTNGHMINGIHGLELPLQFLTVYINFSVRVVSVWKFYMCTLKKIHKLVPWKCFANNLKWRYMYTCTISFKSTIDASHSERDIKCTYLNHKNSGTYCYYKLDWLYTFKRFDIQTTISSTVASVHVLSRLSTTVLKKNADKNFNLSSCAR